RPGCYVYEAIKRIPRYLVDWIRATWSRLPQIRNVHKFGCKTIVRGCGERFHPHISTFSRGNVRSFACGMDPTSIEPDQKQVVHFPSYGKRRLDRASSLRLSLAVARRCSSA